LVAIPRRIRLLFSLYGTINDMNTLLQQAFRKASNLKAEEQDQFARWILLELESEQRWDTLFAESQDALASLAEEALAEYHAGKTEPLDPDSL
jgi:hypothetical protein